MQLPINSDYLSHFNISSYNPQFNYPFFKVTFLKYLVLTQPPFYLIYHLSIFSIHLCFSYTSKNETYRSFNYLNAKSFLYPLSWLITSLEQNHSFLCYHKII